MRVLVTGGLGYVGSHFCKIGSNHGLKVLIYDDVSTGNLWARSGLTVIQGDIRDTDSLAFAMRGVDAVCHFAAKSIVSESSKNAKTYESVNIDGTHSLLAAMDIAGVKSIVFSSTAAVYGTVNLTGPITENSPCDPSSIYGITKLAAEKLICEWASKERSALMLRYFNAAGALPEFGLGEYRAQETHLIPRVINHLLQPCCSEFFINGLNYPTHDGSCIRDYVHVEDLARAHIIGLFLLGKKIKNFEICNLGSGVGYSNLEIAGLCAKLLNKRAFFQEGVAREYDPAVLIASIEKAKFLLGWEPKKSDILSILESAIRWHRTRA